MGPMLDSAAAADRSVTVNSHLSSEDLAALVDGTMDAKRRRVLEEHLALCPDCRDELIGASRAVDTAPRPRLRQWTWGSAIAAAAVLVIVVGLPALRDVTRHRRSIDVMRAGAAPAAAVMLVLPPDNAVVSADSVQFVWRREPTATYRLFVTDSAGGPLFSVPTTDTAAALPPTAALAPGAQYFWYVDALRADGTTLESAHSAFRLQSSR